jgi:DNA-binding CsgD family transcriptional regulator
VRQDLAHGRRVRDGREHVLEVAASGADRPPHESLSDREHQVFTRLAQGRAPSEIAVELSVSPSTVSTYIARIKKQLGAQSIGDIVRYAARVGLT